MKRKGLNLLQRTNQDWGSTANLRSKRETESETEKESERNGERERDQVREREESRAGNREIP